jgi:endonuclease G
MLRQVSYHLLILCLVVNYNVIAGELINQKYSHYQLWIDCDENVAIAFEYKITSDKGNKTRYTSFYDDPKLPHKCEQKSRDSYKHFATDLPKYDRGHLAAANHFDFDKKALKEANYMANVVPQTLQLNRGAWKRTEELIECHRDRFDLTNLGGVIWGEDSRNDLFVKSHGIKTPDFYWRLISGVHNNQDYFSAWLLPNTKDAKSANLKNYQIEISNLVSLIEYEQIKTILENLDVKSGKSFTYKKGCKAYES